MMGAMPEPIIREIVLQATPQDVYQAYTDPDSIRRWFAETVTIADGHWRYEWPGGMSAAGRFLETDPPHRLVWTWEESTFITPGGETQTMRSQVVNTYTFEAVAGGTRFTVDERGHDTDEIRDMNEVGIDGMLDTLRAYLEEGQTVDWAAAPEQA